jgi:DNA primase
MKFEEDYKLIYSKVDICKVLDSYNIIYHPYLGKRGREYNFRCPFPDHDDLSPSFSINEETGIYHCFVCGGGNFLTFIQKLENHRTLGETVTFLKEKLGIIESKSVDNFERVRNSISKFKINEIKENVEFTELKEMKLPESEPAENHFDLVKSRVSLETIQKYAIRYCVNDSIYKGKADGRLIIPVVFDNMIVTFGARDMLGRADKWNEMKAKIKKENLSKEEIDNLTQKYECKKYWYPFSTPMSFIFFNWDEAIKNKEYVIICEGILDAIRIAMYGYNVVASLSSNLTDHKANMLIKNFDKIYVCLDNDMKVKEDGSIQNAGQKSAKKIVQEKLAGANVFNILLPVNKDPDKCSKEEFDNCFHRSAVFEGIEKRISLLTEKVL